MSEAKIKNELRRAHAEKIVGALEDWIRAIIVELEFRDFPAHVSLANSRQALVDLLVKLPPK